jgi:hypothetical protein
MIPLFLAVYAAAVLLAVELHSLRDGNSLLPAFPEIGIMKGDTVLLADPFAHIPDYIVFLIPAVEKRSGECLKTEPDGFGSRGLQAGGIAVKAALRGVGGNVGEEFLQAVFVMVDNFQFYQVRILADGFQPALVFLVGVDVMVVEKAGNAHTAGAQFLHRIYGARRAANVEEYLHVTEILRLSAEKNKLFF